MWCVLSKVMAQQLSSASSAGEIAAIRLNNVDPKTCSNDFAVVYAAVNVCEQTSTQCEFIDQQSCALMP